MVKHFGYKLIDLKIVEANWQKKKGTEDEPFTGPIDAISLKNETAEAMLLD